MGTPISNPVTKPPRWQKLSILALKMLPISPAPRAKLMPTKNTILLKRSVFSSMVFFVGINFALGAGLMGNIFSANIDNFCHLGGFVTGLLMGVPMGGFAQRHRLYQWLTLVVTTAVLVFGYRELEQKYGMPSELRQAQLALNHKDYGHAIQLLEQYTRSNPNDEQVWNVLGSLYAESNQRDKAVAAFQQALRVNPGSEEAKQALQALNAAPQSEDK